MKYIISFCLALISLSGPAQININVSSNPNPSIASWENQQEILVITVINSGEEMDLRFRTKIMLDGNVKAKTKTALMPDVTIERGSNQFFAEDVIPFSAVELSGVNTGNITRTGQLPAGNYQICIQLVDDRDQPVSSFQEKCAPLILTEIQAPVLIAPQAKARVNVNERPTFTWTPIAPTPQGVRPVYLLEVFEVLPGQNPIQAFRSNQPFISEEVEGQTQYWPVEWELPDASGHFIWSVQAQDGDGNPLGNSQGRAQPMEFYVGGGDGDIRIADGQEWTMCAGYVCKSKGVKLEIYVPWDAGTTGSTTYKISSWSVNISYYATADQVIAEFGTTGAPEVDDWIGYISSSSGLTYCDKNGFPIVNQVVYEVTKANPNNYNGNTNELHASGACFDYDSYTSLASHYNGYNGTYADVPTSCPGGCLEGGDNPDDPITGGNFNAANEEIDDISLEPTDGDGGIIGGGLPGLDPVPATIKDPSNIIWLETQPGNFQGYISKSTDFCFCWDGSYCEGQPNCNCCPPVKKKDDAQSQPLNKCECEVNGQSHLILSKNPCENNCDSFKKWRSNALKANKLKKN